MAFPSSSPSLLSRLLSLLYFWRMDSSSSNLCLTWATQLFRRFSMFRSRNKFRVSKATWETKRQPQVHASSGQRPQDGANRQIITHRQCRRIGVILKLILIKLILSKSRAYLLPELSFNKRISWRDFVIDCNTISNERWNFRNNNCLTDTLMDI